LNLHVLLPESWFLSPLMKWCSLCF